jgi:hypothetical protein
MSYYLRTTYNLYVPCGVGSLECAHLQHIYTLRP